MPRTHEASTRSANVVGILPNDTLVICPVTAVLVEEHSAWAIVERRYLSDESMTLIDAVGSDELAEEDVPLAITA